MKKVLIIVCMFFLTVSCFAQTEKGKFQAGIGFLPVTTFNNYQASGYLLRTHVGYSPLNRFSVGILPFMGSISGVDFIGGNLFTRYYLSDKPFSFFVEGSVGFGGLKYTSESKYRNAMSVFSVGPGAKFKFSDKLGVEIVVPYTISQNRSRIDNLKIGNNIMPTIGLFYSFGKSR